MRVRPGLLRLRASSASDRSTEEFIRLGPPSGLRILLRICFVCLQLWIPCSSSCSRPRALVACRIVEPGFWNWSSDMEPEAEARSVSRASSDRFLCVRPRCQISIKWIHGPCDPVVARALWFIYSLSSVSSRCIHSRPSIRGRFSYIVPADLGFGMSCALTQMQRKPEGALVLRRWRFDLFSWLF